MRRGIGEARGVQVVEQFPTEMVEAEHAAAERIAVVLGRAGMHHGARRIERRDLHVPGLRIVERHREHESAPPGFSTRAISRSPAR